VFPLVFIGLLSGVLCVSPVMLGVIANGINGILYKAH
jgi:hypothetical protein